MDAEAPGDRSGTLGASREEQLAFVDVALGRRTVALAEVPAPWRAADIAIVDQNLWADEHPALLGTELIRQLRAHGFEGVCCILTGASDDEINAMASHPGVDLALPKTTSAKKMAESLLAAWRALARRHT